MLLFLGLFVPFRHAASLLLSLSCSGHWDVGPKGATPNIHHLFGHLPEYLLELPTYTGACHDGGVRA